MPRPYPAEFRARVIALVRAGKPQKETAEDLGIYPVTSSKWISNTIATAACGSVFRQANRPSYGQLAAGSTSCRLSCQSVRQAATFLGEDKPRPRGSTR
jgi:transposase